jgi:hypothetical protein
MTGRMERRDAETPKKMRRNCAYAMPPCVSRRLGVPAFMMLVQFAGCAPVARQSAPTTDPSLVYFASPNDGLSFCYPKTWHPVKDDTILTLAPIGQETLNGNHLVIDTPDLPFHIPGLIPMGPVVGGFEDDLKKRYKDVQESPWLDCMVGGVAGREVSAHATGDKGEVVVKAVLFVRGDHVYLIDAETDAAGAVSAAAAYKTVVDTLQWTN